MHVVIVRVTMQLICVFVFTYSKSRFSHDAAGFHVFAIYDIVASPEGRIQDFWKGFRFTKGSWLCYSYIKFK